MTTLNLGKGATAEDIKWIEKNVPKKYWEAIDGIERGGLDGWWLHLKDGYISTTTDTHSIHEYNVADFKKEFKTIEAYEIEEEVEENTEYDEIMEYAKNAETEEERDAVRLMLLKTEDLVQMIRNIKRQIRHIDDHLDSQYLLPYTERPKWEKSKQDALKAIELIEKELERRK